jgi:RNA polymerase-interacting CarD/CdnL/TRCF family regulator
MEPVSVRRSPTLTQEGGSIRSGTTAPFPVSRSIAGVFHCSIRDGRPPDLSLQPLPSCSNRMVWRRSDGAKDSQLASDQSRSCDPAKLAGVALTGLPSRPSDRLLEDLRSSAEPNGDPLTTRAWEESALPPCSPGQQLFDSRHGIVVVDDLESRMLQGRLVDYVALHTVQGSLRILLPLASAPAGSLRRLINAQEASAVLAELGAESQPTPAWTSHSFAELQNKTFGRNPLVVAGIVRDLAAKAAGGRLRSNEQTLLIRGTDLLATELGAALQLTRREAAVRMDEALEAGRTIALRKANTASAVVVPFDRSRTT